MLLLTTSRSLALQMFSKGTETKKWHERMLVKHNLVAGQEWTRRLTLVRKESYYWRFNLTWVSHYWKSCRDCWLGKPSIKPILIMYLLLVHAFCKYFWHKENGLQLTSCCSFLTPSTSLLHNPIPVWLPSCGDITILEQTMPNDVPPFLVLYSMKSVMQ